MINLIPKKYLIILALVAAMGVLFYFWRAEIYSAAQSAVQAAINEDILRLTEARNEIANNRPDDDTTIKRLQGGSY